MRLTLLLFISALLLAPGRVSAQCDYPAGVETSLIISEARMISENWTYLELTNVGAKPLFMNEFKIGKLADLSWSQPVYDLCNDPWWMPERPAYCFLPKKVLMPGKSWVITTAFDFGPEFYKKHEGRRGGSERPKQPGIYEVADKMIHLSEEIDGVSYPGDSVTTPYNDPEQTVKRGEYRNLYTAMGGGTFFIEHHYSPVDSARVDQVGGFFDGESGRNIRGQAYDVAGVYDATRTAVLVRKYTVANGTLDFANSVGISIDDSDWLPIPMPSGYDQWRDIWWTIGNHGNYVLDANTLEPELDGLSVDYGSKTITVPWGVRRLDDIMRNMKKKDGLAWNYVLNGERDDSLYRSAQDGDRLILYAVGNTLTTDTFEIVVSEPSADANLVIPIDHPNREDAITTRTQNGILDWPRVTKHESGIDTITGQGFGIQHDMRVDTLLKYLEKPANAAWEFVWVDGVERADLKNGDKLKVSSASGKIKEYFIQVQDYRPSSNANLSAITWPDIPEKYKDFKGWKGDTIPNFSTGNREYQITVPYDVRNIPALVPTAQDYNATIKTRRLRTLDGDSDDRTISFEVTAEDDSTVTVYNVELSKEKDPENIEYYFEHPFLSEWVNQLSSQCYVEVYNPSTVTIDLRNYAFAMDKFTDNAYDAITTTPSWQRRYTVYIPGLKFVDSLTWEVTPEVMIPDPNVNPLLRPGECFVMAKSGRDFPKYDVCFQSNEEHPNPWNETVSSASSGGIPMPPNGNRQNSIFMFNVLNDSVKNGTKSVDDPYDFEVIDMWGNTAEYDYEWVVGSYVLGNNEHNDLYRRKPSIKKGNPVSGAAFAPGDDEACEWIRIKPSIAFPNLSGSEATLAALGGVGSHIMDPITKFISTVKSATYKVSPGYGRDQDIRGIITGTTVADFLTQIIKEDPNQKLTFMSGADTTIILGENDVISPDDILKVESADPEYYKSYYRLDVTDVGLSSDAVLSSTKWDIEIATQPNADQDVVGEGSISAPEYGTSLRDIMQDIDSPFGATVTIINEMGNYVPLQRLNYDTVYVDVTVSPGISIDVKAEDGKTRIVYNVVPSSTESDAFILSDVYPISQTTKLIEYVPLGVAFDEFLNNIIPSKGATLQLLDKVGLERTVGNIKADDKVIVTSANGEVSNIYYISLLFPGKNLVTYLAYVVSDTYAVSQVDYTITGTSESPLTNETSLPEFMQRITASQGATAVLLDANGDMKLSGNLAEGDMVKVTSDDGALEAYYSIVLGQTSSDLTGLSSFEMYPNPTDGLLNISGLNPENRIHVFNAQGQRIMVFEAENYHEKISLESVPEGLFMIVITDKDRMLGQFKAIKK